MSRFSRQSSYRHIFGDPVKKEERYQITTSSNGDGNCICANEVYFAVTLPSTSSPVLVQPLTQVGRLSQDAPRISTHKGNVLDFQLSPFVPNLIATGSEDTSVHLTVFPKAGLTEHILTPTIALSGHTRKVTQVQFHPVCANIMCTGSQDTSLRVWDLEAQAEALSYQRTGAVTSLDWNSDGSQVVGTDSGKRVFVLDPRSPGSAQETEGMQGAKAARALWLDPHGKLACVGFNKNCRQLALWDPRLFAKPLRTVDIDQDPGQLMPMFLRDNNVLFFGGKGDTTIKYFEVVKEEPFCHFLNEFRSQEAQRGLCWLPKLSCDTSHCEIARALRLLATEVQPVSFQVPRKSDVFVPDLFPDTFAGEPNIGTQDWLKGANRPPKLVSMRPGARPERKQAFASPLSQNQAPANQVQNPIGANSDSETVMLRKAVADLERQLAEARATIAHLEAKLKLSEQKT